MVQEEKKTKIICSISDLHCDPDFIRQLYVNGMNIVRINSAHASIDGARQIVRNVRAVSDRIGILIDTKGPEVRLTPMSDEKGFVAHAGDRIEIHDDPSCFSSPKVLYTTHLHLVADVPVGARILIDDGLVEMRVVDKDSSRLVCEVENDGIVKGRKSVNIPNVHLSLPALTEKDRHFLEWAIEEDIDFVAHSFVRGKGDLMEIHRVLDEHDSHLKIISKIENQSGVDNIDDILTYSYGVMVARGDLGVEIPAEEIPLVQRTLIQRCRDRKKPVIVATQMLQSMISNPRPTRAEVTDVANAIFESADAVMLSGETAEGKYPVEAVKAMTKIAETNEKPLPIHMELNMAHVVKPIAAVLARSAVAATSELPVKAIILDTTTGRTARYLSEYRPKVPIYAMCYNPYTMRELAMMYDVYPYPFSHVDSKEEFAQTALKTLFEEGKLRHGDLVGFIGGDFRSYPAGSEPSATYMELRYV